MEEVEYFIGISLPPKEEKIFNRIKKYYQPPRKPLSSPAHITLLPPFMERNKNLLIGSLAKWAKQERPFKVIFSQLSVYRHRFYATLVLEPEKGEALKKLKISLDEFLHWPLKQRQRRPFRPHLTLANRVSFNQLDRVKKELKSLKLKLELEVKIIGLYSRLLGGQWSLEKRFLLGMAEDNQN